VVRVVELSNYPLALLREEHEQLERERERREEEDRQRWEAAERAFEEHRAQIARANAEKRAAYEAELAQHEAGLQRLRDERGAAPGRWQRFRISSRIRKAKRGVPLPPALWREPTPPAPPPPSSSEPPLFTSRGARLSAGIAAEDAAADSLSAALGEEWTLLRGYRNRRGEIDQLLLGPAGLIAVEIKYRNATVYVNGDDWRFEKFDNYGNRVEEGPMHDDRGRSPSQQLNEPAAELEKFLASRNQEIEIDRVVMLTHDGAKVGGSENLNVTIAYDVDYLVELIGEWDTRLEPEQLQRIERLIVKDHNFHERQRENRRRPSPPS
jgi:Nuclease-related domain